MVGHRAIGRPGVVVVHEPGASDEGFTGFEEVRAGSQEGFGGGVGADVEDIAGEDAFDDGVELGAALQAIDLAADLGEQGQHGLRFRGL